MESVLRAVVIYIFLMVILRLSGKRTFSELTTFDFILLLIISETTQQALLGEDFSITNAIVVIFTLVGLDVALSFIKQRFKSVERLVEGVPLVILENGKPLIERMTRSRIDEEDILAAGRSSHGLTRLDQIKYAVLERSGGISIIPKAGSES